MDKHMNLRALCHQVATHGPKNWPADLLDRLRQELGRSPPATVPADALERLVAEWLTRVRRNDGEAESMRQNTYEQCADELAALIPKGEQS